MPQTLVPYPDFRTYAHTRLTYGRHLEECEVGYVTWRLLVAPTWQPKLEDGMPYTRRTAISFCGYGYGMPYTRRTTISYGLEMLLPARGQTAEE